MENTTHTLFKSEPKVRPVTLNCMTQSLPTVANLVVWNGFMLTYLDVMDGVVTRIETGFHPANGPDPITAYRLYRGLCELSEISNNLVYAMGLLIVGAGKNIELSEFDEFRKDLYKAINPETFTSILQEIPPDLEKMVADLRAQKIFVDTSGLQREVSAGRLEMRPWLRDLGVDHQDKLNESFAGLRERASKLLPLLQRFAYPTGARMYLDELVSEAVDCYRRGIDQEECIVALAVVRHKEKILRHSQLAQYMNELLSRKPIPAAQLSDDQFLYIIQRVAFQYSVNSTDLNIMVRAYYTDWPDLKIVI